MPEIHKKIYEKCSTYVNFSKRRAWLSENKSNFGEEIQNFYKVIFYDFGCQIKELVYNIEEYEKTIKNIFLLIQKYLNKEEIGIKNHPNFEPSIRLDDFGIIVPKHFPGEWLQKNNTMLLGIFTTCVYNAKTGNPISLVNLINFKDEKIKKEMLNVSRQRVNDGLHVKYPSNIHEFEHELINQFATNISKTKNKDKYT